MCYDPKYNKCPRIDEFKRAWREQTDDLQRFRVVNKAYTACDKGCGYCPFGNGRECDIWINRR